MPNDIASSRSVEAFRQSCEVWYTSGHTTFNWPGRIGAYHSLEEEFGFSIASLSPTIKVVLDQVEQDVREECGLQICGHPVTAIVSSEEGTHYCSMCEGGKQ